MISKSLAASPPQEPLLFEPLYPILADTGVCIRKRFCALNLLFVRKKCISNATPDLLQSLYTSGHLPRRSLRYNDSGWVGAPPLSRDFPPMASVAIAPTHELAPEEIAEPTKQIPAAPPVRPQVRMGRVASLGAGINWLTLSVIVFFHIGALAALFFFTWQRLTVMLVLSVLAINVGIGMCYHRLLTHRGYQAPRWLEYAMSVCATLSLEGGPIFWVATHRVHHQFSDQEGDPHTPREGGWWAHTGWLLWGNALHAQTEVLDRYVPDLIRSRFLVWLSKYHWIPLVASGVALFGLGWIWGGWSKSGGTL